jgi:DNA-binding GntR family transcriptional regulator
MSTSKPDSRQLAFKPAILYLSVMDQRVVSEPAEQADRWARRKGKLQLEATDRLRSMIVAGELRPGEPLREVRLSERLGVSRTPIREALRTLAAEGMVDLLPNRSAVVAKLHSPDIGQLFDVVGVLEALAGELACARITEAEIAEIADIYSKMVNNYERCEREPYLALNHLIHRRVVEIAGSPVLLSTWQSLLPRVERGRALANLDPNRWLAAVAEHSRMLAALAARDGATLARLTREHFTNGLRYIPAGDD